MSKIFEELMERGYIEQITHEEIKDVLDIEKYSLNEVEYRKVSNGNSLYLNSKEEELLLIYQDKEIAIYQKKNDLYKPKVMLI